MFFVKSRVFQRILLHQINTLIKILKKNSTVKNSLRAGSRLMIAIAEKFVLSLAETCRVRAEENGNHGPNQKVPWQDSNYRAMYHLCS